MTRRDFGMQARGTTLVELAVVIGIAAVLLALAYPRFIDYLQRYRTEAQTRLIYGELLKARANALYQRRETRLTFYPERFEIYSSTAEDARVAPTANLLLHYPIALDGAADVVFDERGIALEPRSLCIADGQGNGALDSVVISKTRISIGKKDQGDACNAENITKR